MATYINNVRDFTPVSEQERQIIIDGVVLPPCDEGMSFKFSDLDSTAVRSWKTGKLKRNRIRANVMSIENMKWSHISVEVARQIIASASSPELSVEVYDFTQGKRVVKNMYRSADFSYFESELKSGHTATLSFSLIEL